VTIRFSNGDDHLELQLVEIESDPHAAGDARILIDVRSSGFCGNNDVWISAESFRAFCSGLVALESSRSGDVTLESLSPNELNLTISSVDSVGHFGVFGTTGHHDVREHGSTWHSIDFGFEFDPSQLATATNASWISENSIT